MTSPIFPLDVPLLVCDADGRVIRETPALTSALATDEQSAHVRLDTLRLAADLAARARSVHTDRGTHGLRATVLPEGASLGPRPAVLVAAEAPRSPWPTPGALRRRFGLTRREAEVALLLARGLANDAAADALCISPHTVRRHTERVMAKLSVVARGQVAAAILEST